MHVDADGNEQSEAYKSTIEGGCYTKLNQITESYTYSCQGIYTTLRTSDGGHPGSAGFYDCSKRCGNFGHQGEVCGALLTGTRIIETYYTLNCNKTTSNIESAIIVFD